MTFDQWLDIAWKVASAFGGLLAAIGITFWWIMRVGFVSKVDHTRRWTDHIKEHDDLDDRLNDGERKFTRIGADMDHRPSSGMIDELRGDISRLDSTVAGLSANDSAVNHRLGHMERQLDKLVEFHLMGGK